MEVEIGIRSPKIALFIASPRPRERVKEVLALNGLTVVSTLSVEEYLNDPFGDEIADAIFVDLDEEIDEDIELLDKLLTTAVLPVVFSDSRKWEDFEHWGRRISIKLFNAIQYYISQGIINNSDDVDSATCIPVAAISGDFESSQEKAEDLLQKVWVLAASLGGPDAVAAYLSALVAAPNACFILVQHIGDGFADILATQLNKSCAVMDVVLAKSGTKIDSGKVIVAPVGERIIINPNGVITLAAEQRPSLYKPSIDFLIDEVALRYGINSGVIIFTGMGDDGANGCGSISKQGGVVWAQDAETCVISSMPDCARETGYVCYTGNPAELANKTISTLGSLPQEYWPVSESDKRAE